MSFLKGVARILGKIISSFINLLSNSHGDVSTKGTIKRAQKILPDTPPPPVPKPPQRKPSNKIADYKIVDEVKKTSTTSTIKRTQEILSETKSKPEPPPTPPKTDSETKTTDLDLTPPPPPPPPPVIKFMVINIADAQSWEKFRGKVLTLDVLTDFFQNRDDDQSPQFLNSIEQYRKSLEKKLVTPEEIDENASYIFADKLAHAIKKRFYPILRACRRGLNGKGGLSKDYYKSMDERINRYFESIGLKSLNIKPFSNFRDYDEYMTPSNVPTENRSFDNLISEIEIQPHYFEYYNETGEIEKFWLDGECSVFVFNG